MVNLKIYHNSTCKNTINNFDLIGKNKIKSLHTKVRISLEIMNKINLNETEIMKN